MNIEDLQERIQELKDAGKIADFKIVELVPFQYELDLWITPIKAVEFIQIQIKIDIDKQL